MANDVPKPPSNWLERCWLKKHYFIGVLFLIILSSIYIAALLTGLSQKTECPANSQVPTWLVTIGVVGIACLYLTAIVVSIDKVEKFTHSII